MYADHTEAINAANKPLTAEAEFDTTFHNVTLTVRAKSARQAYDILGKLLSSSGIGWASDTYSTNGADGDDDNYRDTDDLF